MVFLFTTATEVTNRRKVTTMTTAIDSLIAEVSAEVESLLGRHVAIGTYTDVLRIAPERTYARAEGPPVTSVTSAKLSTTDDFSSVPELTRNTDYAIFLKTGGIRLPTTSPVERFLELVYEGGFIVDTADAIANFPDLAGAVTNEVIGRINRIESPEGDVELDTPGGGSIKVSKEISLGKQLRRAIARYQIRRMIA